MEMKEEKDDEEKKKRNIFHAPHTRSLRRRSQRKVILQNVENGDEFSNKRVSTSMSMCLLIFFRVTV